MEEKRHVFSLLVNNNSGVLSRVAGLFARRGYNIDSLTVSRTENNDISRMTIVVYTDDQMMVQIKNQVNKLIEVIKIDDLDPQASVFRELVMIKIDANSSNRAEVIEIANIFRAHIVDVSNDSLIIEATGDFDKTQALIDMLKPYGVKEVLSTGLAAIERGPIEFKNKNIK